MAKAELSSYSGNWTPWVVTHDGEWLGGVAHDDIDRRRPGKELYVGGKRGNLYQVWPHPQGGFDASVIAYPPGREIHPFVAGDLDGSRAGIELIAFTHPGGLYLIEPGGDGQRAFTCRMLEELPGRVRDAVVLEMADGSVGVATVSRAGDVGLLRINGGTPTWTTLYKTQMGLGRIAAKPRAIREPIVLQVACDDGRILRLAQRSDGTFHPEVAFAGALGPRGIVAGRFHADPRLEAIAVFGYSKAVQLLTHENQRWRAEAVLEDLDWGHWLAAGEVDGRNATDEIILSGYGARVVLLARPPGPGQTMP